MRSFRRETTSTACGRPRTVTSVSIHLLANDTGCVLRHTYDEDTGEARPFRSGYVNAACEGPVGVDLTRSVR